MIVLPSRPPPPAGPGRRRSGRRLAVLAPQAPRQINEFPSSTVTLYGVGLRFRKCVQRRHSGLLLQMAAPPILQRANVIQGGFLKMLGSSVCMQRNMGDEKQLGQVRQARGD